MRRRPETPPCLLLKFKKLPSLIISSTPVKIALDAKEQEKMEKERKKRLRQLNKDEKIRNSKVKKANQKIKKHTIKRKVNFSSSSESSCEDEMIGTEDEMDMSSKDDENCIIYGLNVEEAKSKKWIYDFCQ
ncbi:hypothetical protein JTB14_018208 [Gonioctena quinquepunctata]|nr:hypothetical protein JTB14_018208 [Gonioctena quinquepunctata]